MSIKKKYETPKVINLYGLGASGDISGGPGAIERGVCRPGTYPYYSCVAGPDFSSFNCNDGATFGSACGGGGYHAEPSCNDGASAATVCMSGYAQQ